MNRRISIAFGHELYPSYYSIGLAKKECYPSGIVTDEVSTRVDCRKLILHTVNRILQSVMPIDYDITDTIVIELKFGFDGCSSNSNYMLNFSSPVNLLISIYI